MIATCAQLRDDGEDSAVGLDIVPACAKRGLVEGQGVPPEDGRHYFGDLQGAREGRRLRLEDIAHQLCGLPR